MCYYLLRQDRHTSFWRTAFVDGMDVGPLGVAVPVEEPVSPVSLTLSAWGRSPSDLLELPCLAVSNRLRSALDRAGVDNVQYFEAAVSMEHSDEVFPDYWLANVIGSVACVDPESTRDALASADPLSQGFWIDPTKTCGADLFRLAEDPSLIVISGHVAEVLRVPQLSGVVLQETREYAGKPVSMLPAEESEEL
jgi:hypothetical protein